MNTKTIRVTAAVILDDRGVFITQRHANDEMGELWEFPGGKIEPGETPEACLQRELLEELGILTDVHELFAISRYAYPRFDIELFAYRVTIRSGPITLHTHQDSRWAAVSDLQNFDFSAADLPIVERLMTYDASRS